MTFVRTDPGDTATGYLTCDARGCAASSPPTRLGLGQVLPDGWKIVKVRRRMQPTLLRYACPKHADAPAHRFVPSSRSTVE